MEIKRRGFLGGAIASLFGVKAIAKSAPLIVEEAGRASLVSTTPAVQNLWKPGLRMIPLDKIRMNPMALRAVDKTSPHFQTLVESIRKMGVMTPATVRDDGTLVDGAYRYEAAREAGLTHLPSNVMGFDTIHNLEAQLYGNNTITGQVIEEGDEEWEQRVGWDDEFGQLDPC